MIYVHIPFCRSFCTYCDFYSEIAGRSCLHGDGLKTFEEALVKEVELRKDDIRGSLTATDSVCTLYIGGGTPSVLPLSVFRSLLDALEKIGAGGVFEEFTVEVNPDDIVEKGPAYVEGLLELGVNRISMGVQSFDDGILKWMNRRHDGASAVRAYRILEEAGADNISIDLIFGFPQLTDSLWTETLERALAISSKGILPSHISSYQLSVEPGSALAALVRKGGWKEASEEQCSRQYEILCNILNSSGYRHYEISNFALPGREAVHNSAYWSHRPYVGIGPGAHSLAKGDSYVRSWNEPDLRRYVSALKEGTPGDVQGREVLDDEQIAMERIMLGLRTSEGVEEEFLSRFCGEGKVAQALKSGNLKRIPGERFRIPEDRFFVSDDIISSLV